MQKIFRIFSIVALLAAGCQSAQSSAGNPPASDASAPVAIHSPGSPTLPLQYHNPNYNFTVSLPASWKGFSILSEKWAGSSFRDALGNEFPDGERTVTQGPMVIIRNPRWTAKDPCQDIPIMVFTLDQWINYTSDSFFIGAGGIAWELGEDSQYVYVLPPRYDVMDSAGRDEAYEVIDNIMAHSPAQRF